MDLEQFKHAKILIVDDDPNSLRFLVKYLAMFDFTVVVV